MLSQISSTRLLVSALSCPAPQRLHQLLQAEMDGTRSGMDPNPILLPCCYDGLTARLVARAGFEATFMTGFGVSGMSTFSNPNLLLCFSFRG